jgi:hypothetical protein
MATSKTTDQSRLIPVGSGTGNAGATPDFLYQASSFDPKYEVKGLSYPNDLMTSPDYGHNRVVFYINVSVDSRALRSKSVQVVQNVDRSMRSQVIGEKITDIQAATASGVMGAVGGTALGAILAGGGGGATSGAAVGGLLGVGGTAAIGINANNQEVAPGQTKALTFERPQKRLQSAVALYIPNQLSTRYSAQWGEEDTAMFSALAKGGKEIGRAFEGDASAKRTGGLVAEVLGAAAINVAPGGQAAGLLSGLAANPKKEQAFTNVDFRTFTFEYQFAPKDIDEAENVLNIIRTFKYHMHPEFKSQDAFLYVYPSEFDIMYYKGSEENLNIHRHTSCVLTELNVNYTPNGVFNTFPNGMPTQINVTMNFKELMLLSKETIEKYT